jgi:hypothetical protein
MLKSTVVAVLLAGAVAAAEAKDVPKPSSPPAQPAQKSPAETLKHPIVFYLAKGSPDSCGQGCSEWIAADGIIDEGASERMRAFLKRLSGPKRPIYFMSPGGTVSDALAMGRLMRDGGFTAGVGQTIAENCEPKECADAKKAGRELQAKLSSFGAYCASACVYALVGARTREVAPEARLGIHAGAIRLKGIPKGVRIPPGFISAREHEFSRRTKRYLAEMGIKPALLDAAQQIPHEDIKNLTRGEIVQFGIDTRSFVESGWTFEQRAGVVKSFSESTPDGTVFRTTIFRLVCLGAGQILLGYSRSFGAGETQDFVPVRISAGRKNLRLDPPKSPAIAGDKKNPRDNRQQWVPVSFFEAAMADDHMTLTEGIVNPRNIQISTFGLSAALASLHCSDPRLGQTRGTALTPNQSP